MRALAIFFVFATFSQISWAAYDVTCTDENCMRYGWQVRDTRTGETSQIQCLGQDCEANGWLQRINGRFVSETTCLEGGCWVEGFKSYGRNGQFIGTVECNTNEDESNCLTLGWVTYNQHRDRINETTCIGNDCARYGWDVEANNGYRQVARCKENDCFTYGWSLIP